MTSSTAYKKIVAVIREERFKALEAALIESGVAGLTVFPVRGFGKHPNLYRSDWTVSHLQIEIYTPADSTTGVVNAICGSMGTTVAGDGILAVLPVDSFTHFHRPDAQECTPS